MRPRLFDIDIPEHRSGSRALVVISPHRCPACGYVIDTEAVGQPALFLHSGYGATEQTTRRHCHGCGWSMVAAIDSLNPRSAA